MKKHLFILVSFVIGSWTATNGQKWKNLSDEEKLMKVQSFIEDNQKYMKDSLNLSADQIDDAGNVNICYLTTLDRINRYGKTDADKEKYAKSATESRAKQLEAIMGSDNYKKFRKYVEAKLKKALANQ